MRGMETLEFLVNTAGARVERYDGRTCFVRLADTEAR
jgi:hypothetical protein